MRAGKPENIKNKNKQARTGVIVVAPHSQAVALHGQLDHLPGQRSVPACFPAVPAARLQPVLSPPPPPSRRTPQTAAAPLPALRP